MAARCARPPKCAARISRRGSYGQGAERNYWTGCSTGGRQGFELAQSYGHLFDGFLVGAPAFAWNRFIMGNIWPAVAAVGFAGPAGVPPAKSAAANAAALAACDANDGVTDGLINEPRRCAFNANALLCTGSPTDPATCLTPQEADAVNAIWDGPRNEAGERLWGGIMKSTTFNVNLPGGNGPNPINLTYLQNWLHQDPAFDWRLVTLANYSSEFEDSYKKFKELAATDDYLSQVKKGRAKIIHYHGISDPLIPPFGSYNYVTRVFSKYGVEETQSFMRSFFYPGVGHCAGGPAPQPNTADLFNALQDWAENGNAPDYVVAHQTAGTIRSRKICKYPDEAVYSGSGSVNDAANFQCVVNSAVPADLAADALTNKD